MHLSSEKLHSSFPLEVSSQTLKVISDVNFHTYCYKTANTIEITSKLDIRSAGSMESRILRLDFLWSVKFWTVLHIILWYALVSMS